MKVACPFCGQPILARDEFCGQNVACPSCAQSFSVPFQDYKYWAFISYSHQDNLRTRGDGNGDHICWANWLHEQLETFRIPQGFRRRLARNGEPMPERFFPAFRDEAELPTSHDLGGQIRDSLERSRFLIVIASPRSACSRYVNEEVRYFRDLGRSDRIFVLIIDGEPNVRLHPKPGWTAEHECFCPALVHPLRPDGSLDETKLSSEEPIAADVRLKDIEPTRELRASESTGSDQRGFLEFMKLKLFAGLMGVGLDELVQRDRMRALAEARSKTRRVAIVASTLGVLAIAATASAFFAIQQRNIADRNEREALRERDAAWSLTYEGLMRDAQQAVAVHDPTQLDAKLATISKHLSVKMGWEYDYLSSIRPSPPLAIKLGYDDPSSDSTTLGTEALSLTWGLDDTLLATTGASGGGATRNYQVKIWNVKTGKLHADTEIQGSWAGWRPGTNELAVISKNELQLLNDDGSSMHTTKLDANLIRSGAWNGTGERLALLGYRGDTASYKSGTAVIWLFDALSRNIIKMLEFESSAPSSIAWSPDGKFLAVSKIRVPNHDNGLSIFEAESGLLVKRLSDGTMCGICLWPQENVLIENHRNGRGRGLSIYDTRSLQSLKIYPFGDFSLSSRDLSMATCRVGTFEIRPYPWDVAHVVSYLRGTQVAWSNSGRGLATSWTDPNTREIMLGLWDPTNLQTVHLAAPVRAPFAKSLSPAAILQAMPGLSKHSTARQNYVSWSGDSNRLALAGADGKITLVDASTGKQLRSWVCDSDELGWVGWSGNGRHLMTLSNSKRLSVWTDSGEEARKLPHDFLCVGAAWNKQVGIVAISSDGAVWFISLEGNQLPRKVDELGSGVTKITSTRDGSRIVAATADALLHWIEISDSGCTARHIDLPVVADCLSISDDGKSLVFSAPTGIIMQCKPDEEGPVISTLFQSSDRVFDIRWSPDANRLLVVRKTRLELLDSRSGTAVLSLPLGDPGNFSFWQQSWWNNFWAGAWSPDGERIAGLSALPPQNSKLNTVLHVFQARKTDSKPGH